MRSLRDVIVGLRAAFNDGGIEPLYEAHLAALKESISYWCLYRLANLFLPITPLFGIIKDLDRLVGEFGASGGSKVVLGRFPVPWRAVFPERGEEEIRTSPIIVYGKHGSILTPSLLAVALNRPDLKMVGASYIARLGPNIAKCTFAVCATTPLSVRTAARQGLAPRAMGWLACKLDRSTLRSVAKERNREALGRAAEHVRAGGGLLIAPDSRTPGEAWRPGLGSLVARLAAEPGARPCYLVPWRIWNASIPGIFQLLSRNPLLRALGHFRFRHPVRVEFGEPLPLREVVARTGLDPAKITAYLEEHYKSLGY